MKTYKELTENIRSRINPENISLEKSFSDELSTISYNDVLLYIRLAMKGVDDTYTQKSKLAGERVKSHLESRIQDIKFEYQGSVMTNTHIVGYSDIDLLTICDKFYSFDNPGIKQILDNGLLSMQYSQESILKFRNVSNGPFYSGNSLEDLKALRTDCEKTLTDVYDICNIENPKCIKIKNLSLKRDVDVVIANWYEDALSISNGDKEYKGIQIYDKDNNIKLPADFPFLSISRINARSTFTNGRLKKMIRFLKNLKANSDHEIPLNSFDINAICYNIDVNKYSDKTFYELVPVLYFQLASICNNDAHANSITSVDSKEYIFKGRPNKLQSLRLLLNEISGIYLDLRAKTLHS